jgi:hypothetical protein
VEGSGSTSDPQGLSTLALVALAVGAAGFGFGAYFYAVPYHRKAAQLEQVSRELRTRTEAASRHRMDVQGEDVAARILAEMKALQAQIDQRLGSAGASVTLGPRRMLLRFPEEKVFESRGPWLSKPGQEALQTLAQLLGTRTHRLVIAAPMGSATVPRWIRGQLPTPADLSAARAGNALKAVVKGGVRAETVLAVIGTLTTDAAAAPATLDFEIEP